jgi:hypothetical protein
MSDTLMHQLCIRVLAMMVNFGNLRVQPGKCFLISPDSSLRVEWFSLLVSDSLC